MEVTVLGIDLAKSVFQLHGVDRNHKMVFRKKLSRAKLPEFIATLSKCLIVMESCIGAHAWGRKFVELGHEVKLIAPEFVKPFVKSNKNDAVDAEAIVEAAVRPNMRFVAINTIEQQDIQLLHRARERLVRDKVSLMNQIRGLLLEYGIALPKGKSSLEKGMPDVLSTQDSRILSEMGRQLFTELLSELRETKEKLVGYDKKIEAIHKAHPVCKRLAEIPGVGPLTATAMLAIVGDPKMFKNGRQLSAYLGLVPRQHSTGGKDRLLGISKRGDPYIRKLLIHGARTVLQWVEKKSDPKSLWLKKLIERRGMNRATVALANKNARVIWVLMTKGERYRVVQDAA
jgi:transposase